MAKWQSGGDKSPRGRQWARYTVCETKSVRGRVGAGMEEEERNGEERCGNRQMRPNVGRTRIVKNRRN